MWEDVSFAKHESMGSFHMFFVAFWMGGVLQQGEWSN